MLIEYNTSYISLYFMQLITAEACYTHAPYDQYFWELSIISRRIYRWMIFLLQHITHTTVNKFNTLPSWLWLHIIARVHTHVSKPDNNSNERTEICQTLHLIDFFKHNICGMLSTKTVGHVPNRWTVTYTWTSMYIFYHWFDRMTVNEIRIVCKRRQHGAKIQYTHIWHTCRCRCS